MIVYTRVILLSIHIFMLMLSMYYPYIIHIIYIYTYLPNHSIHPHSIISMGHKPDTVTFAAPP